MLKVTLKKGREYPLLRYHPWVFSGAVDKLSDHAEIGCPVEVYSYQGVFLAMGFWHGQSIAVKVYSFQKEQPDEQFWNKRVTRAQNLRRELNLLENSSQINAFRVFNAEGDGVPGLIIDLYGTTSVIQIQAAYLEAYLPEILSALTSNYSLEAVVLRSEQRNELIWGEKINDLICEWGIKYKVDLLTGQKTGFFLDQRENRKYLQGFAAAKKVLNTFCYSGGFTLSALKSGAAHVTSLDSSSAAIDLLSQNLKLNLCDDNHQTICADCFDFFNQSEEKYDLIVLDPPAFCKHRDAIENALRGYGSLNQQAMRKLSKGGVIFTFSCSQLIGREDFKDVILKAAAGSGKRFKIIRELHAAACHPYALSHAEGEYLKGFILLEI